MRPALILNPRTDEAFTTLALRLVEAGVDTPQELQAALRQQFPSATVHARELDGERQPVLYVYRDGRWTT
jgi:hypothetical protein